MTKEIEDNKLIIERKQKLEQLRTNGNPYINGFTPKHIAKEISKTYQMYSKEQLEEEHITVSIAGRIILKRVMGKSSFAHIMDRSDKIQIYVSRDDLPDGQYNEVFKKLDIGDIIGVKGYLFKTKTGELSIRVTEFCLLTKSLRPLPEKFHGLSDIETKYRKRYVDLIVNENSRKVFATRSKIINYIRNYFISHDFMEVETPMMQTIPGGASAKPFVTHHNALDMQLYLRIAPELYLKRLIVGGMERVFEINRNFRNEGLSTRHNPEFTMIEFYEAYATYEDLMDRTEELFKGIATHICGTPVIAYGEHTFDFSKDFTRMSVVESILLYNPKITEKEIKSHENAAKIAKNLGITLDKNWGLGKIQIEIFEATVEEQLINPTFITGYPKEVSPLARVNDENNFITDRFELFIGGREIANGFNELNDPEDQKERFLAQVAQKEAGNDEAMFYDADYIEALEYGMPPTAGEGIGIDRLIMLFTNSHSIRDVLLFPQMKKE